MSLQAQILPLGPRPEPAPVEILLEHDGDLFRLLAHGALRDLWHALLWSGGFSQYATQILMEGLLLRPARPSDYAEWAMLRRASRRFLQPWEPLWPADDLTPAGFRRRLRRDAQDWANGTAHAFLLLSQPEGRILGGATLGSIRRGVAQTAMLGYWMGEAHAGQGLMRTAVGGLLHYAFRHLGLNRVEAVCMPTNRASQRVLMRNGFQREGTVRSYLKINGVWQDHDLYAILAPDQARRAA